MEGARLSHPILTIGKDVVQQFNDSTEGPTHLSGVQVCAEWGRWSRWIILALCYPKTAYSNIFSVLKRAGGWRDAHFWSLLKLPLRKGVIWLVQYNTFLVIASSSFRYQECRFCTTSAVLISPWLTLLSQDRLDYGVLIADWDYCIDIQTILCYKRVI